MVLESTVSVAKPGVNSVRATVPEGIVDFLDIKAGDKLVWKMEFHDNERFAIVTKKPSSTDEKVDVDSVIQKQKKLRKEAKTLG